MSDFGLYDGSVWILVTVPELSATVDHATLGAFQDIPKYTATSSHYVKHKCILVFDFGIF